MLVCCCMHFESLFVRVAMAMKHGRGSVQFEGDSAFAVRAVPAVLHSVAEHRQRLVQPAQLSRRFQQCMVSSRCLHRRQCCSSTAQPLCCRSMAKHGCGTHVWLGTTRPAGVVRAGCNGLHVHVWMSVGARRRAFLVLYCDVLEQCGGRLKASQFVADCDAASVCACIAVCIAVVQPVLIQQQQQQHCGGLATLDGATGSCFTCFACCVFQYRYILYRQPATSCDTVIHTAVLYCSQPHRLLLLSCIPCVGVCGACHSTMQQVHSSSNGAITDSSLTELFCTGDNQTACLRSHKGVRFNILVDIVVEALNEGCSCMQLSLCVC
jgi:hypothetical protein